MVRSRIRSVHLVEILLVRLTVWLGARRVSPVLGKITTLILVITLVLGCRAERQPASTRPSAVPSSASATPRVVAPPARSVKRSSAWSAAGAASYLDDHAAGWLETRFEVGNLQCAMTCHTTFSFAVARGALPSPSSALATLRQRIGERVALEGPWRKQHAFYGKPSSASWRRSLATESVLNAAALALSDEGETSPATRRAIARMWEMQRDDGAWSWLDFGLEPWEAGNDDWGAAMAALAAGVAKVDETANLARLRSYLRERRAEMRMLDALALVWASLHMDGLLDATGRAAILARVAGAQHESGGFSTAALIGSKKEMPPDGIASGLFALVTCRTGSRNESAIRWLERNQRPDGAWPAQSISTGRTRSNRFMKNAATAFAVLALTQCRHPS
jgi:hypothetical protein